MEPYFFSFVLLLCHFFSLLRRQCLVNWFFLLKDGFDHFCIIDADYHGKDMGRERAGPGEGELDLPGPGEIMHNRGASEGLEN